jgi:hypothetical protein
MQIKMLQTKVTAAVLPSKSAKYAFVQGEVYQAENATNQPDWREKGLVFVSKPVNYPFTTELLLEKGEYEIVG